MSTGDRVPSKIAHGREPLKQNAVLCTYLLRPIFLNYWLPNIFSSCLKKASTLYYILSVGCLYVPIVTTLQRQLIFLKGVFADHRIFVPIIFLLPFLPLPQISQNLHGK